ncbi:MAG: NAD(+) synthase [Tindallia sp. MSAO_Bac2]|nr:MAG: NAD(+) synthase [Tindallia sp. MSAO_Bac2]
MDLIVKEKVEWLEQKTRDAGMKGLIVGLSGGIDSAVVANLIKRAVPDQSMAVILPISSNEKDIEDALKVAKKIDIHFEILDLTDTHQKMMRQITELPGLKTVIGSPTQKIADANLRARLRMSALYAIANAMNYLVVGTDNAAELYTGYFTKYGDGGVDLLPIADLLKRDVYNMARYLEIPESILNKDPSAGLWDGQTDEEELGISYQKIDDYLAGKDISEKDKEIIRNLHKKTQHKREMPPVP